mmetsp:Transcript_19124/g.21647  ORF Transcript_19124/g.21647 Transcript_19124/m.21647 type:complete len:217 (+) Transcript_19124:1-651(+)
MEIEEMLKNNRAQKFGADREEREILRKRNEEFRLKYEEGMQENVQLRRRVDQLETKVREFTEQCHKKNGNSDAGVITMSEYQIIENQIRELEDMHEGLVLENQKLKDQLKDKSYISHSTAASEDPHAGECNLYVFKELKNMKSLINSLIRGEEPNMKFLIDMDDDLLKSPSVKSSASSSNIDESIEPTQLKEQVKVLKNLLCDYYARQYGDNCTTQ